MHFPIIHPPTDTNTRNIEINWIQLAYRDHGEIGYRKVGIIE